jgi:hypothetical protein
MTEPEDMRLAALFRTTRRGAAKLEQRPKKLDLARCGARCRTRGGRPCFAPVVTRRELDTAGRFLLVIRTRCRMHGGLSTGRRRASGNGVPRQAGAIAELGLAVRFW